MPYILAIILAVIALIVMFLDDKSLNLYGKCWIDIGLYLVNSVLYLTVGSLFGTYYMAITALCLVFVMIMYYLNTNKDVSVQN